MSLDQNTTAEMGAPRDLLPSIEQAGSAILRASAAEVPFSEVKSDPFQRLIEAMVATMRRDKGVGLAAPQIGQPWRVIVLEDKPEYMTHLSVAQLRDRQREPFELRVLVNPVLRVVSEERATFFESCLSVSGYVGLVERASEVEVSAFDEQGRPQILRVAGWMARIFQHEVDHLDGTLYVDRMKTRSFVNADHWRSTYKDQSTAEVERILRVNNT